MGFVDHGRGGSGEPVAGLFRPGNAGSNTAADHIKATQLALAQLPKRYRRGRGTLIRTDSAGGTHEFVARLAQRGRWLSYSVGMTITDTLQRPHPGAQLRIIDADGLRLTCFATNTTGQPITALELRHRQRARAEDRIRTARATGLRNTPLHDRAQNQIWLEIVQLALDLLAWMPMLALTGKPRLWEPRRLRLRLFSAAAQLVTAARHRHLRFADHWPWTDVITGAVTRLEALPNPG